MRQAARRFKPLQPGSDLVPTVAVLVHQPSLTRASPKRELRLGTKSTVIYRLLTSAVIELDQDPTMRRHRPIAELHGPWLAGTQQPSQTRHELRARDLLQIGLATVGLHRSQHVHLTALTVEFRSGSVRDSPAVHRVRIDHQPAVELLHHFAERHSRAKPAGLRAGRAGRGQTGSA